MKKTILLILVLRGAAFCTDALACFANIPLSNVVRSSTTVVVGKIESIETNVYSTPGDATYTYDVAQIRVREVLKNSETNAVVVSGGTISLSMPATGMEKRNSKAITFQLNQDGIWILQFGHGYFWATYPKDFQPLSELENIREIVREEQKTSNHGLESTGAPPAAGTPETHP
ncbi:MAG: hypothetical protein H7A43_03600 [Verrucomicrobia bacterium]|nr:hypothetical protein [Verrucomicrobiota bacterium]